MKFVNNDKRDVTYKISHNTTISRVVDIVQEPCVNDIGSHYNNPFTL